MVYNTTMPERADYTLEGFLFYPSQDGGLEILQTKNLKQDEVEKLQHAITEEAQTGTRSPESILWKYFAHSDDTLVPIERLFEPFIPEETHPVKIRIIIEQLEPSK